jgi:hypothetical protein
VAVWNSRCPQQLKLTSSIEDPRGFVPHQGLNLNVLLVLFLQSLFLDLSLARLELLAASPFPLISGNQAEVFSHSTTDPLSHQSFSKSCAAADVG